MNLNKLVNKLLLYIKAHLFISVVVMHFFIQTLYLIFAFFNSRKINLLVNCGILTACLGILIFIYRRAVIAKWKSSLTAHIRIAYGILISIFVATLFGMFFAGVKVTDLYSFPLSGGLYSYFFFYGSLLLLVFMAFFSIIFQIIELYHVHAESNSKAVQFFQLLFTLIFLIQSFAIIYIAILCYDHNAITGLDETTPIRLTFDITYFSAMTLLSGNCDITPNSVLAKTASMIETFAFVIIIAQIISGYFKKDNNPTSLGR